MIQNKSVLFLIIFYSFNLWAARFNSDGEVILRNALVSTQKLACTEANSWDEFIVGQVRNSLGKPIAKASIIYLGHEYFSDKNGLFQIASDLGDSPILIKKAGYRKVLIMPSCEEISLNLEPIDINSLYLPTAYLKNKNAVYANAMNLIETTEVNALTIDVKNDFGNLHLDLAPYVKELKSKGVYTIARIVVFKDNATVKAHPEFALINKVTGAPWKGSDGMTFIDPYNETAWNYIISIAQKAALMGFDEIQFDYVRFPTDGNKALVKWSGDYSDEGRTNAIANFLALAQKTLSPLGVFIAADVFGISAFETKDLSKIGQKIEKVAPYLDYVCPMVYPSGYAKGTGGVADPVNQPGSIVGVSIRNYRVRADKVNPDLIIRPWLQAFNDYSPAKKVYTGEDIRKQIDASDNHGGSGWLLWNAAGKYHSSGLKVKKLKVIKE